ncbi:MAG: hypothetical protein GY853_09705 [PVC group bacterium]|nr:hypothetical protein [PVC group bacterium]
MDCGKCGKELQNVCRRFKEHKEFQCKYEEMHQMNLEESNMIEELLNEDFFEEEN